MTRLIKNNIAGLLLILIIAFAGFYSCGSAPPTSIPSASPPSAPGPVPPPISTAPANPEKTINRVDVIYFHLPQRCVTCICFEEHIANVVKTNFQKEIDMGKLTFQIINAGDKKNEAITKKYKAMSSQLFINTIRNGVDEIVDIQDIWSWKCLNDTKGFEAKVKSIIEIKLNDAGIL